MLPSFIMPNEWVPYTATKDVVVSIRVDDIHRLPVKPKHGMFDRYVNYTIKTGDVVFFDGGNAFDVSWYRLECGVRFRIECGDPNHWLKTESFINNNIK